jgi:zinc transport system substrate-binding protein
MRTPFALLCLLAVALLPSHIRAEQLNVVVSILPQATFVRTIGKDLVSVEVMVQPGASPATYEPKPKQMAGLTHAQIYFAVGAPFEAAWLDRFAAANPALRVVHTEAGIEKIPMAVHHHHEETEEGHGHEDEHGHGHAEEHGHDDAEDHGILDPHVWLAPALVKVQAQNMAAALAEAAPQHGEAFEANLQAFLQECDALDAEIRSILADSGERNRFMVFHPAWGYFAQAYNLTQVPIETEGKEPSPAELHKLIEHARHEGIEVVFVQPQFSEKSAATIAQAIGGRVVKLDPLAPDWRENLLHAATAISGALR